MSEVLAHLHFYEARKSLIANRLMFEKAGPVDEARDAEGKWTSGGGGSASPKEGELNERHESGMDLLENVGEYDKKPEGGAVGQTKKQGDLFSGVGEHGKEPEGKPIPAPPGGIFLHGTYYHTGEDIPHSVHSKLPQKSVESMTKLGLSGLPDWTKRSAFVHQLGMRSYLFNNLQTIDDPAAQAALKAKVFAANRKMLDAKYNDLADKNGDFWNDKLDAKVRGLFKQSDDYFQKSAGIAGKWDAGSGGKNGWDQNVASKFFTKANFHITQALRANETAKQAAGVEWPHGESEHHDVAIKKMQSAIEASAAKYSGAMHGTKGEQVRNFFTKEAKATLAQMSPRALQIFNRNIGKIDFVIAKGVALPGQYNAKWGGWAKLGGGPMKVGNNNGVLAHEMGHTIDNNLSSKREWIDAYKSEIDIEGNPLSEYARTKPLEGFAEFARLMWTSPPTFRAQEGFASLKADIAQKFPKALAFWRKHVDGVQ